MTHFLRDILRQPEELRRTLEILSAGDGHARLHEAVAAVRSARHVYLTGIGSSWHAALNVGAMFQLAARPVYLVDAAELLQFAAIPAESVLIVISRSGRSIEIVQLLAKARAAGATVIGITNAPDGALAREAQIPLVIPIALDHAISVNTYTTLALAAGMVARGVVGESAEFPQGLKPNRGHSSMSDLKVRPPKESSLADSRSALADSRCSDEGNSESLVRPAGETAALRGVVDSLTRAFAETGRAIPGWQAQLEKSVWLATRSTTYFLSRGTSLGSAQEARLMWEEGVKSAATAMATSSFRHGPQEIVARGIRVGMWLDAGRMREQDLALARDLRQLGASVMLIGQDVPADAADLVFHLPAISGEWQFVVDIIPAQLAAERLARLAGVDPDTFRLCSFVVDDEGGLLAKSEKK